jgi:galactokinase
MNDSNTRDHAIAVFVEQFGRAPTGIARAPGRVNLIGEHTDYNDGFVLPVAIDRAVWIAFAPRDDGRVHLIAANYDNQSAEFLLEDFAPMGTGARSEKVKWVNYPCGVAWALQPRGIQLRGFDGVIYGDVPAGAGLSSSAAIELATAVTFQSVSGFTLPPQELARVCQVAENEFVGNRCGIMDQFISALGRAGHALLIDCRDLSHKLVPLPDELRIVICNSMLERALTNSAYNTRRLECESAVELISRTVANVRSLRDVTLTDLEIAQPLLPDHLSRRCRHVVTENARVLEMTRALEADDYLAMGKLMAESHESLKNDFEVSCRELDALVDAARKAPGCVGARLTGAGFGGCTVNLVLSRDVEEFSNAVRHGYQPATGRQTEIYVCESEDGASVERIA